jgi:hypothetical protein
VLHEVEPVGEGPFRSVAGSARWYGCDRDGLMEGQCDG